LPGDACARPNGAMRLARSTMVRKINR
jgi:hypothetical protein